MHVVPGQQLFYYGSRVWPDNVRKQMYDQFGGMPKDLATAHDYDPKVNFIASFSLKISFRANILFWKMPHLHS